MWEWLALGWLLAAASAFVAWSYHRSVHRLCQHQNVSSFTVTFDSVLCAPYREASYEIEESKAVRDGLCETQAALKQAQQDLHTAQKSQEQLESEVQQEQLKTVCELFVHAKKQFSVTLGSHLCKGMLQKLEKHKAQRLAKQLEDKNVQAHKLR